MTANEEFRAHTPMLVTFELQTDRDHWLRDLIHGNPVCLCRKQHVIVQGSDEAHRLMQLMAMKKYQRHQPYGGGMCERLIQRADGPTQKAS